MSFDDSNCQSTLHNVLTGTSAVTTVSLFCALHVYAETNNRISTQYDYLQRPIKRITAGETIDLAYDSGGANAQSRLVSVKTSSGIQHHYDYDTRGNLALLAINLDDKTFETSYKWSPTKKVSQTVNPDGTFITRDYFDQTNFIKSMAITDEYGSPIASTAFTQFNITTQRPHTCTYGNGVVSAVTMADNGTLTSSVLAKKSGTAMHIQHWTIDSFSKIQSYKLSSGHTSVTNQFAYDDGGNIITRTAHLSYSLIS